MTDSASLLPETTLAVTRVRELLTTHGSSACEEIDPQVLDYLTRYIVVLLCNELERKITGLLIDRVIEAGRRSRLEARDKYPWRAAAERSPQRNR